MPDIRLEHITFSYDTIRVVDDVSFIIPSGAFFSLIGPNGAGKTTVLKLISHLQSPGKGEIFIGEKSTWQYSGTELAKLIAVVPQKESIVFPFSVQEVVLMGRSPHLRGIGFESKRDKEIARRAMTMTDIVHLALRPVTELSGGEQHRVSIARALAQQTPIILLDEPNAHLDIHHQIELFDLLKRLNQEKGTSIVCVSHDINLASQYSDHIALMSHGKVIAIGTPKEVVTGVHIQHAFNIPVEIDLLLNNSIPRLSLKPGVSAQEIPFDPHPITPERTSVHDHKKNETRMNLIRRILSVSVIVEIFGWMYLTFIRYDNQGLSLSSFDLFKSSNLISLFFGSVLLGTILLHYRKAGHLEVHFAKMLLTMSFLSIGFLLWNFYPDTSVKFIAAMSFIFLKTYQTNYSLLRHINRKMKVSVHTMKSLALSAISLIMILAATLTFTWISQRKAIDSYEGLKADAAVFFPTMNSDVQKSSSFVSYSEIASGLFSTSSVKKIYLIEGNISSIHFPSSDVYKDFINAGIPSEAIRKIDDGSSQNHLFAFVTRELKRNNDGTIIVFCDPFRMVRIQEMFSFHSMKVIPITINRSWSMSQLIAQRIHESILLFLFWTFGM